MSSMSEKNFQSGTCEKRMQANLDPLAGSSHLAQLPSPSSPSSIFESVTSCPSTRAAVLLGISVMSLQLFPSLIKHHSCSMGDIEAALRRHFDLGMKNAIQKYV